MPTLDEDLKMLRKRIRKHRYTGRPVGRPSKADDTVRISVRISQKTKDRLIKKFGSVTKAIDKMLEVIA